MRPYPGSEMPIFLFWDIILLCRLSGIREDRDASLSCVRVSRFFYLPKNLMEVLMPILSIDSPESIFSASVVQQLKKAMFEALSNLAIEKKEIVSNVKMPTVDVVLPVQTGTKSISLMHYSKQNDEPECIGSFTITSNAFNIKHATISGSGLFFGLVSLEEALNKAESVLLSESNLTGNPLGWKDPLRAINKGKIDKISENGSIFSGMISALGKLLDVAYQTKDDIDCDLDDFLFSLKEYWEKHLKDPIFDL